MLFRSKPQKRFRPDQRPKRSKGAAPRRGLTAAEELAAAQFEANIATPTVTAVAPAPIGSRAAAAKRLSAEIAEELPVVSVSRSGNLFLNEKPVNINNVADEISTRFKGQKAVYLRADKATPFDPIAQVMDALNKKFQIRVVVKPEDTSSRR